MARPDKQLSLKSRGKKRLSSLNQLFAEQLENAPREFVARRLTTLIKKKAPNAPRGLAEALARHLAAGAMDSFVWETDHAMTIDVRLEDEDLAALRRDTVEFVENELPRIMPKVIRESAKIVLRSLKADWLAQRAHDDEVTARFSANLETRWGDAFSTLRMMYVIAVEIGADIAKARGRSRSKKNLVLNDTLVRLHARACQVLLEIITLIESGLADGAMARWRTLHEITVVATLLAEYGEELAVRYRSHDAVEAKRAMDRYVLHHAQLGYAAPTKREISQTDKAYRACLLRFGDNFGSDYGWAAHHLGLKKPRLIDLESAAGRAPMQSYYRMASYNVHAGSKGITFRLGLMEGEGGPTALAGASNTGFVDPAQNAAQDILHMTTLLAHDTARFDRMIEWEVLALLRDELAQQLAKAQEELEQAHAAQLKLMQAV